MARVLGVFGRPAFMRAVSPAVCARHRGHGVLKQIRTVHASFTRNLWCAAGAGPRSRQEEKARAQAHRPTDARGRTGRRSRRRSGVTTTRRDKEARPALIWSIGTSSPPAEPALGGGHHLRADGKRLSVPRRRAGCLEPQGRRLVDGPIICARAGCGRAGNGDRPATAGRRYPSQRPRQPVQPHWHSANAARKAGVRPSMGIGRRRLRQCDVRELSFATLECELLDVAALRRRRAKIACFTFIEGWYNPVRLHSALGYRSPMAYEQAMEVPTNGSVINQLASTPRKRATSGSGRACAEAADLLSAMELARWGAGLMARAQARARAASSERSPSCRWSRARIRSRKGSTLRSSTGQLCCRISCSRGTADGRWFTFRDGLACVREVSGHELQSASAWSGGADG